MFNYGYEAHADGLVKTWTLRTLDAAAPSLRMRAQLTIASPACLSVARVLNRESKSEEEAKQEVKRGILKIAFRTRWASPLSLFLLGSARAFLLFSAGPS